MERTALRLMDRYTGPDEDTVGTYVEITHSAPAPALLGQEAIVAAEVTAVNGRRTTFSLVVSDATEQLASATHERFTVELGRLEAPLREKQR